MQLNAAGFNTKLPPAESQELHGGIPFHTEANQPCGSELILLIGSVWLYRQDYLERWFRPDKEPCGRLGMLSAHV